jgi:hypothetical protein
MIRWKSFNSFTVRRFCFFVLLTLGGLASLGCRAIGVGGATEDSVEPEPEATQHATRQLEEAIEKGFEDSMRESARKTRLNHERKMQRLAAVESVSGEQFDAAWKIDLDCDRQPARQVLAPLLSDMGLRLPDDSAFDKALDTPVSLRLDGGSRLQAIELVCAQVGLYPGFTPAQQIPDGLLGGMVRMMQVVAGGSPTPAAGEQTRPETSAISLHEGKRPHPLVFFGPFAAEVSCLEEFTPYASGSVELRVHAGGMPDSVLATRERLGGFALRILEITSSDGRDLLANHDAGAMFHIRDEPLCASTQRDLKGLVRNVHAIRIAGKISARIPTTVETLRFDELEPGAEKQGKEVRIQLTRIELSPPADVPTERETLRTCSISFNVERKPSTELHFVALDDAGKALQAMVQSGAHPYYLLIGLDDRATKEPKLHTDSLVLCGEPKTLVAKAFLTVDTVECPFEMVADLQSFQEQPVDQPEPQPDAHLLVNVQVQKISGEQPFRQLHMRVTNMSNHAIRNIQCRLDYKDASGNVVEHHDAQLTASPFPESDGIRLLADKRSVEETTTTAFHAPDNMTSATATVTEITFADNTTWRREE